MTPKERANQLVNVYYNSIMSFLTNNMKLENAKKCALIAVDEIISEIEPSVSMDIIESRVKYWNEVRQEIKNI
jgi:hypothetical protein